MKQLLKTLLLLTTLSLNACAKSSDTEKIASIPEASGISFCENTKTLIVANDEGSFYELSPSGAILSQHKLGKYDLEGVICEEKRLMFAVEDGAILEVNRQTLKSKKLKLKGEKFKLSKKAGIEGVYL